MALFGRRRATLRIAPELDDTALGRVRAGLASSRAAGPQDMAIAMVEQLLRDTGDDWDRRAHRVGVLAEVAVGLARGWCRRRPRDPDALTLHAWAELAVGRSTGTLEEPWAVVDTCRQAAELRPDDPTPWVAELGVLRLLGRPWAELAPIWNEIRKRDPWHREAHLQLLGYLSPEEQGSQVALLNFVGDATAAMPAGVPTQALELTVVVRQYERDQAKGGMRSLGAEQYWLLPRVSAVLDRAVAQWPHEGPRHAAAVADDNLAAYALVKAARSGEAEPFLRGTQGLVTAWPWSGEGDPVEHFSFWYKQLQR